MMMVVVMSLMIIMTLTLTIVMTFYEDCDVDDDITFSVRGAREGGRGRLTVAIFTVTPDSLYPPHAANTSVHL